MIGLVGWAWLARLAGRFGHDTVFCGRGEAFSPDLARANLFGGVSWLR